MQSKKHLQNHQKKINKKSTESASALLRFVVGFLKEFTLRFFLFVDPSIMGHGSSWSLVETDDQETIDELLSTHCATELTFFVYAELKSSLSKALSKEA